MAWVESFNNQEQLDFDADIVEDWDVSKVDFPTAKEAVDDIDSNKSPMEVFGFDKMGKRDNIKMAAENIIKGICWKEDISNIKMEDIYQLTSENKCLLARKLVAIQPLDIKLSQNEEINDICIKYIMNFFLKWYEISQDGIGKFFKIEDFNDNNIIRNWYEKRAVEILKNYMTIGNIKNLIVKTQKNIFKKAKTMYQELMFKSWQTEPPFKKIYNFATWDLSSTQWIWWQNVWRYSFEYDFKNKNTIEKELTIWTLNKDATIRISAEWINKWVWWSFEITIWNTIIEWNYTEGWITLQAKNGKIFPKGVDWDGQVLKIDSKIYRNQKIKLKTQSNKFTEDKYSTEDLQSIYENYAKQLWKTIDNLTDDEKSEALGYDEVMFLFTMDNIGIAPTNETLNNTSTFGLWIYEIWGKDKSNLINGIQSSLSEIDNANPNLKGIPFYFSVSIDSTPYKDLNNSITTSKVNELKTQIENNKNINEKEKWVNIVENVFSDFTYKIENNTAFNTIFSGDQLDAQKHLAQCRFLNAIAIATENKDFVDKLLSWKININTDFDVTNKRSVNVFMDSEDLNYKHQ